MQMTKMMQNLLIKLKITDFLLGFGYCSKSLFCRYWCFTYVYQFSCMYVKRSSKRTPLKVYRWRCRAIFPQPMEYWPSAVFRPGLLSNIWSLRKIRDFMTELQQLLFPWRDIKLLTAPWTRPLTKTQDLHNLPSQRPLD